MINNNTIGEKMTNKEKVALKKKQYEIAMTGDTRMLIWLGKQYLGQKDSPIEMDMTEKYEGVVFVDEDGNEEHRLN